jgi:iron complex outermembrane receptor protein
MRGTVLLSIFCSVFILVGWLLSVPLSAQTSGIPTVIVEGEANGSAEVGYKVDNTQNFSIWGDKPVKELPYSVTVVTEEFIDNISANSPGAIFYKLPNTIGNPNASTNMQNLFRARGFGTGGNNGAIINGVQTGLTGSFGVFIEDMESVEIYNGLSGFLYGPANIGGVVNYNTKKPKYDYINRIRLGSYSDSSLYASGDFTGPIIDDVLAYRINILGQSGHTSLKPQKTEKGFLSAAFEWKPTSDLSIFVHGLYGKNKLIGRQMAWGDEGSTVTSLPGPPDPKKLWAPKNNYNKFDAQNLGFGVKYNINEALTVRAAYEYIEYEREMVAPFGFFITNDNLNFRYQIHAHRDQIYAKGAYAFIDAKFKIFDIENALTVGVSGYRTDFYANMFTYGTFFNSFSDNTGIVNHYLDTAALIAPHLPKIKTSDIFNYSLMIADDIKFNEQWQLMLGLSHTSMRYRSYPVTATNQYEDSVFTPTIALLFKPIPQITTYASYIESVERGTLVGPTYANAGQLLNPYISEQYEIGVKADFYGMLFTLAAYQIDRELQYANSANYYVQDGLQRHRGLEISATGKLFDSLTLVGGINISDNEVKRTSNLTILGKSPNYAPEFSAKLFAEYDLPFLPGLTLNGAIYHVGKQFYNNSNRVSIPAFTIGDLGFRYKTKVLDQDLIFRFNVTNLTNKAYWDGGGSAHLHLGAPRTFTFSTDLVF